MMNPSSLWLILSSFLMTRTFSFQISYTPSHQLMHTKQSISNPLSNVFNNNASYKCSSVICLSASPDPNNENDDNSMISSFADRFVSPRIDDIGLPLADALVAQIVAPSFQVFWLGLSQSPLPSWLRSASLFRTRGSLVAPTLIHGAGLASCWLAGALSAKAFESESFDVSGGKGYGTVISRIVQAGAFATGILILSTQISLLFEFGNYVQLGDSEETDLRLITVGIELITDIFFEAVTLSSWRLYRASLTADSSD